MLIIILLCKSTLLRSGNSELPPYRISRPCDLLTSINPTSHLQLIQNKLHSWFVVKGVFFRPVEMDAGTALWTLSRGTVTCCNFQFRKDRTFLSHCPQNTYENEWNKCYASMAPVLPMGVLGAPNFNCW